MKKLSPDFYTRKEVTQIAQELLGKFLCTDIDGKFCSGKIVETEAYSEREKGCHAYGKKQTDRTRIFYHEGGVSYVYLCYGIHHLFNIVTNDKHSADAILIRAIEPVDGIEYMMERRNMLQLKPNITAGPGVVSKAMGINRTHYGADLQGKEIWVEDRGVKVADSNIVASPRVGIDYAGEDALLPWRYRVKDNKWASKAK